MSTPAKVLGKTTGEVSPYGHPTRLFTARRAEAGFTYCQTGGPACRAPRKSPESSGVGSKETAIWGIPAKLQPMELPLSALLSRALVAFAVEFEKKMPPQAPSLAMWSNVLQFAAGEGTTMQELRARSGLSNAAMKSMVACMERHGWVQRTPQSESERIRLTARGFALLPRWAAAAAELERDWNARYGTDVALLRTALERLVANLPAGLANFPIPLPNRGAHPTGE
jgi:DNA-binding MarR family transcriptional regulator